ncbi:MAG TPA: AAA family ATPase [Gemmataceae bacterium]|nr:AAA family ATPase [Gemmataceae bacterium]
MPGYWSSKLAPAAASATAWLWHGYLAPGGVTVLTSQWKSGKTTLVAVLLARMAKGGQLAGRTVRPGRAVVISEESHLNWQQRNQKLHFGDNITFLCRPFPGKPTMQEWSALVDALVLLRQRDGLDLVVIDPLVNFLPGRNENLAGSLVEVLLTLQRLTSVGVCVLILHHPRKGETRPGQASRGSGALGGYADILLEMRWYGRPADPDRRRVIEAYSRHEETPRRLVIERTADGTDYVSHGDVSPDDFAPNWEIVQKILKAAEAPLTRREIRRHWPPRARKPDEVTLWRWLERLVGEGAVVQEGSGRRNDPYRFRLASE